MMRVVVLPILVASALVAAPDAPSRVYYAIDPGVIGPDRRPVPSRVQRMVDTLVMSVTGAPDAGRAWLGLVGKDAVVGLKVSASAGPLGGTRVAVAEAVASGLRAAGLPRERIVVWDRGRAALLEAGFSEESPNYTLRWSEGAYDSGSQVSAPVLGKLIWGDSKFGKRTGTRLPDLLASGDQLSSQSFYSKLLAKELTRVINIPAATDSMFTGIHGAIASMTLPNLDNWRRFVKEPHFGDPFLPEIYADPIIRDKVVLTILDALFVQYAGGPHPNPNCTVDNATLFASKDPVALDATLIELIDEHRKASRLPLAREMAGHVGTAESLGLGHARRAAIQTLRAGAPAVSGP